MTLSPHTLGLGDLVEYDQSRWVVAYRNNLAKTVTLSQGERSTDFEVACDDPALTYIDTPKNWPFITGKTRPGYGHLVSIERSGEVLRPLIDWVPSNFKRPGGPVFFNPSIRLRVGEVLVAIHANGTRVRMSVTSNFKTVADKTRKAAEVKKPPTVYDHLVSDSDIFDD